MSNNCQQYSAIKENIQKLIEQGKTEAAEAILCEYEGINPEDADIYSLRASILLSESKVDEAIALLDSVVGKYPFNFDLLYNLGFITEQSGRNKEALKWYQEAQSVSKPEHEKLLAEALIRLGNNATHFKTGNKKKLAVFVKPGLDSFLGDIIKSLSSDYIIKKIVVTNNKQVDEGMEWADICWFEWCDELIAYGSKLESATHKDIICRLHSYEAFTEYPLNVNWQNINKLIFVAEHIRNIVLEKVNSLKNEQTIVIPNGLDLEKLRFKPRKSGFKIAYVGYINFKKGPMLLLHVFKAIFDRDSRYKMYIAGTFQDERDVLYYRQMIREMGLDNNVFYEGWQNNLDQWLEDKNYILCTSLLESQNISVMQAMSKGIKPLIHNFIGAKGIYPEKYLWTTIGDCLKIIDQRDYNSIEYRNYIETNFALKTQLERILLTLSDLTMGRPD